VYLGSTLATNLKISGVNLFSAGKIMESPSSDVLRFEDEGAGIYKKLVIENRRLKGAVLFRDTADRLWYLDLICSGADVSHLREMLAFGAALALSQAA
jgi:nitrite reductase (NADH) large subunit